MEFKDISISNFGGIEEMAFSPERVNLIMGPNGSGKTSFLKAMKYLLLGDNSRSQLLNNSALRAEVSAWVNGSKIQKVITPEKNETFFNGKRSTQKSVVEYLQEECGASKDAMKFVASSEVFEKATGADFTDLLLNSGFLPMTINADTFVKIAKTALPFSKEDEDVLRSMLPSMPDEFGLDLISSINDDIKQQMKYLKKEADRLSAIVSSYAGEPPKRSIEDVDRDYAKVISEKAVYARSTAERRKTEETKKQIEALKAQLAASKAVKPNPAVKAKLDELYERINNDLLKASNYYEALKENTRLLQTHLDRLQTDKCPLSDKIVCKQDKEPLKAELSEAIKNNSSILETVAEDIASFKEELSEYKEKIAAYQAAEREYLNKISLLKRVEDLEKTLPSSSTAATPEPAVSKDYASLEAALKAEKERLVRYNAACAAQKQLNEVTENIRQWSVLNEVTSNKGAVKSAVLETLLSTIVDDLNEMASELCPHIKLGLASTDGKVCIYCTTPTGTQDLADISTGEKLMVQFLIMSIINKLSGFRLLVLDNIDKLDKKSFEGMLEFLTTSEVADIYDHVFIAGVDHEDFIDVIKHYPSVKLVTTATGSKR